MCVQQTTLPTLKRNYRKWILLIFVHEREPIPNGSFTNWQIWQFLQRYPKMYPCVVKILYYLNRSRKIKMWTALPTNRTRKNHTKTIFASSEHLLFTRMEMRDSKKKHPKFSNLFLNNCGEADPSKFQGVHLTDNPKVKEMLKLNNFLYGLDIVDGELTGELARRNFQKFEKSVKFSRYNNHICYVSDMTSSFKSFRCSKCDTIFSKVGNLERHLITCSVGGQHICPKNVYQLRETLFEKLDSFNIPSMIHSSWIKSCLKTWPFLVCVKENTYKETETTKWIGKHVPILVSISSNLIPEPIFLCNSDPRYLVSSFVSALEGLATQSKAQMKWRFVEVETATMNKLSSTLEQLNQRHSQQEQVIHYENDDYFNDTSEEKQLSIHFLQMQKNHLIDLQEHYERYCNTLPVFGFNSAKYNITLIKSYLLPILVNERQIEPAFWKS